MILKIPFAEKFKATNEWNKIFFKKFKIRNVSFIFGNIEEKFQDCRIKLKKYA